MNMLEYGDVRLSASKKKILHRLGGERHGDRMQREYKMGGAHERSSKDAVLSLPHNNTKKMVKDLKINKELYFERHVNIHGQEQKI